MGYYYSPRLIGILFNCKPLTTDTFHDLWQEAVESIVQAYQRITTVYGAFNPRWIPYTTLTVPLAALLLKLKKTSAGAEAYQKVDCWYWGCVLGQRYDSAVDTKTYQDYRDITQWIENKRDSAPEWLQRLALSVQSLNIDTDEPYSTLYRGLMGLIAKQGAWDFSTGQPAELNDCHDDHIFPKSIFGSNHPVDSLLNRTLISKDTNRAKGNKLPSEFLDVFWQKHGKDDVKLQKTLATHFISLDAYAALKNTDFERFISERRKTVEKAVRDLLALAEPVDVEPSSESETVYWLTPVRSDEEENAETVIQTLVGEEGIYAFGDKTPGRRNIKAGDWICFYATGKGVVAHAKVSSRPDRRKIHPRVRHSDKYPWVFTVEDAVLYLDQPIPVDESLRSQLEAFEGRDPSSPWAWFVQATRKVSQQDFQRLTKGENEQF
ncbi:HNH endonuclease domain-containing protein [Leptodesmis sichuanensis]|uniref:HNH endonuclease domain-containing protein n=1 Tax=Leptodesmis sichuanensis TaxID=2906798 RepID=UPI001F1F49E2|nr:HNH endonuclease domain-containing protein [Leptodesmis sichuanensis]UIE36003.1 EVE domain-containing protein [Leptodesmis sichuanensis A121]